MIRIESTDFSTSKIKTIGLLLVSLGFIALGLYMVLVPWNDSVFPIFRNRAFVVTVGLFNILFFGVGFLIFIFQLFGYSFKENKIKIDKTGITDKYRLGSFGHIPWTDIAEIKISTIDDKKYLTILVHNPTAYIDSQRTLSNRKEMEDKYKQTGSPINISSGLFSVGVDKLKMKIETKFIEYKKGSR
jgi:hypothetical protein